MDGYTFMLERNRRLIQHEAALREGWRHLSDTSPDGSMDSALRQDLLLLYRDLDGCGRLSEDDPAPSFSSE